MTQACDDFDHRHAVCKGTVNTLDLCCTVEKNPAEFLP